MITAMGTLYIQISIPNLGLIDDVGFQLLSKEGPILLCKKDLYDNGLDISIQLSTLNLGDKPQPLTMKNLFLVYWWAPDDIPFELCTQEELEIYTECLAIR